MSFVAMKPRFLAVAGAGAIALALCADVPAPRTPLTQAAQVPAGPKGATRIRPNRETQLDINTASREALLKLNLDPKTVSKIIAGRPYLTKTKLTTNKVISQDVFLSIRDRIKVVIQDPKKAISRAKAAHPGHS